MDTTCSHQEIRGDNCAVNRSPSSSDKEFTKAGFSSCVLPQKADTRTCDSGAQFPISGKSSARTDAVYLDPDNKTARALLSHND